MKQFSVTLVLCFVSLLYAGCASGYRSLDGRMVFSEITTNGWIDHEIREPISGSFSQLSDPAYAKDDRHVFWRGIVITGALPRSFRCLGEFYSKDESHVYWRERTIEGADPITFILLNGKNLWAKDDHDVYFADRGLNVHDVSTFVLIKDGWAKDDGAFYYAESFIQEIGLVSCRYESMIILDEYYAKDAEDVFYQGRAIVDADSSSFRVTGPWAGADRYRTYKFGKPNYQAKE